MSWYKTSQLETFTSSFPQLQLLQHQLATSSSNLHIRCPGVSAAGDFSFSIIAATVHSCGLPSSWGRIAVVITDVFGCCLVVLKRRLAQEANNTVEGLCGCVGEYLDKKQLEKWHYGEQFLKFSVIIGTLRFFGWSRTSWNVHMAQEIRNSNEVLVRKPEKKK